jgi:hypothetical protein
VLAGLAALAALALGGSALAGAQTSSSPSPGTTTQQQNGQGDHSAMPAPGSAAHENAEKAVSGDAAAKARAAAVKSVGGGTAGAVTTDFGGRGYEVTVTKADGTKVDVHLDSSFTAGRPCPGGPGDGAPSGAAGPGGAADPGYGVAGPSSSV